LGLPKVIARFAVAQLVEEAPVVVVDAARVVVVVDTAVGLVVVATAVVVVDEDEELLQAARSSAAPTMPRAMAGPRRRDGAVGPVRTRRWAER